MAEMNEEWITREKVEEFGLENVVDDHAKKTGNHFLFLKKEPFFLHTFARSFA